MHYSLLWKKVVTFQIFFFCFQDAGGIIGKVATVLSL